MGRDDLLDAAFAVMAREGEASPESVAREAGASKALVFHHFRSVAGLHDAMAERVLRETQAGLDALAAEQPNPRLRLEALARALLAEPPERPAEARRILAFWLGGERGAPRSRSEGEAAAAGRGAMRDALVSDFIAKTLREMRAQAPPSRVASHLLARWHGATTVYANGGTVDFEAEAESAIRELDALLVGRR